MDENNIPEILSCIILTHSKITLTSSPYFEVKQQLDIKLQHQKQNVTDLQSAIKDTKAKYSNALRNLEKISEEIHQSRRDKIMLMFPRQPGVGAESGSSLASMVPDFSLGIMSFNLSKSPHRQM